MRLIKRLVGWVNGFFFGFVFRLFKRSKRAVCEDAKQRVAFLNRKEYGNTKTVIVLNALEIGRYWIAFTDPPPKPPDDTSIGWWTNISDMTVFKRWGDKWVPLENVGDSTPVVRNHFESVTAKEWVDSLPPLPRKK